MRRINVTLSSVFCLATITWAGSALALNPQPEPPKPPDLKTLTHNQQLTQPDSCMASQTMTMDKHLSESARTKLLNAAALTCTHKLNPQPLPPG